MAEPEPPPLATLLREALSGVRGRVFGFEALAVRLEALETALLGIDRRLGAATEALAARVSLLEARAGSGGGADPLPAVAGQTEALRTALGALSRDGADGVREAHDRLQALREAVSAAGAVLDRWAAAADAGASPTRSTPPGATGGPTDAGASPARSAPPGATGGPTAGPTRGAR